MNRRRSPILPFVFCMVFVFLPVMIGGRDTTVKPEIFVDVQEVIPNVLIDMRYYGSNNFIGERIDGYLAPRPLLTRPAVQALAKIQQELNRYSLGIKIFDAYRPQQAVDHFVRWAKNIDDTRMKKTFYPDVDKKDLFVKGFIASRSSHSRGSTVDLTIISLGENLSQPSCELDMGTSFDFFGECSHSEYPGITVQQRVNRLLLRTLMEKHGFQHYAEEWWHFTLKKEPFPDTYFNFPIN